MLCDVNRRALVLDAGYGHRVDRTPVAPYMGNYAAALVGVPIDEYCTDSSVLAEAQIAAQKTVDQDVLVAQSDGYYMAEALGLQTRRRQNATPVPESVLIDDLATVDRLTVPDPQSDGRMPVYLDAVRTLVRHADGALAVRACGTGAFSLAGHLLGPDSFVTRLALLTVEPSAKDEASLRRLMEICTETTVSFALEALESGADIVMNGDSLASLDMISPEMYEAWVWPYERAFFDRVRPAADSRGALALLHVCGNTLPILGLMADSGAHVLEVDWKVSLAEARRVVADRVALMGNLDPSAVLLQGSREDVFHGSRTAIAEAGAGFLLGSGCEVAPQTPLDNMKAMVAAAQST